MVEENEGHSGDQNHIHSGGEEEEGRTGFSPGLMIRGSNSEANYTSSSRAFSHPVVPLPVRKVRVSFDLWDLRSFSDEQSVVNDCRRPPNFWHSPNELVIVAEDHTTTDLVPFRGFQSTFTERYLTANHSSTP